jgi:hypothetical protein
MFTGSAPDPMQMSSVISDYSTVLLRCAPMATTHRVPARLLLLPVAVIYGFSRRGTCNSIASPQKPKANNLFRFSETHRRHIHFSIRILIISGASAVLRGVGILRPGYATALEMRFVRPEGGRPAHWHSHDLDKWTLLFYRSPPPF